MPKGHDNVEFPMRDIIITRIAFYTVVCPARYCDYAAKATCMADANTLRRTHHARKHRY